MTEQAAKLTVKVKLHAAQPVVVPSKAPPARLSKLKVTLGLLVLVLSTGGGYLLWQHLSTQLPHAVAAESTADISAVEGVVDSSQQDSPQEDSPQEDSPQEDSLQEDSLQEDSPEEGTAENTDDSRADPSAERDLSSGAAVGGSPAHSTPQPVAATEAITATSSPQDVLQQPRAVHTAEPDNIAAAASRSLPEGFSRIVLSATMERLEPGEVIDTLVAQQHIQRLYLFTELKGYAGQQLIHRWSYAGEVKTEALLTIEDSPWRTYSENWLLPDQLGKWRVEIIDQQQKVLYQHDFEYH